MCRVWKAWVECIVSMVLLTGCVTESSAPTEGERERPDFSRMGIHGGMLRSEFLEIVEGNDMLEMTREGGAGDPYAVYLNVESSRGEIQPWRFDFSSTGWLVMGHYWPHEPGEAEVESTSPQALLAE